MADGRPSRSEFRANSNCSSSLRCHNETRWGGILNWTFDRVLVVVDHCLWCDSIDILHTTTNTVKHTGGTNKCHRTRNESATFVWLFVVVYLVGSPSSHNHQRLRPLFASDVWSSSWKVLPCLSRKRQAQVVLWLASEPSRLFTQAAAAPKTVSHGIWPTSGIGFELIFFSLKLATKTRARAREGEPN